MNLEVVLLVWATDRGGRGNPRPRRESKDFRPECNPEIGRLTIDRTGRPLCTEILRGNTADVTVLMPVADRL